jgi:hypothetical protein
VKLNSNIITVPTELLVDSAFDLQAWFRGNLLEISKRGITECPDWQEPDPQPDAIVEAIPAIENRP